MGRRGGGLGGEEGGLSTFSRGEASDTGFEGKLEGTRVNLWQEKGEAAGFEALWT